MSQQDHDFDYGDTLKGKPTQLNAEDLRSGPITVRIERVRPGADDQPVAIYISGGHMPWKPCLTMRRLLRACTDTTKGSALVGRWVTLYCDPAVRYGKLKPGGVRMSHLSGLDSKVVKALQVSKDRFEEFTVEPLRGQDQQQQGAPTADLDRVLADLGITVADLDAYRATLDKPPIAEATPEQRAAMAVWLGNPANAAKVRPASSTPENQS